MRDGQAGLGHPPWRGGGGVRQASGRVGGFLKSERPEAGQPRRIYTVAGWGQYPS